ncbi:unnamed protein product [Paramecium pentaurelia]|uniref:Uncharacterized protein n=1 Tax=Paramecium pentaurelia TaxID=43138 RepID=A0A8S1TA25_9CILI|nr:unnamed protein product [Paramecium pentaurelia]
MQNFNSMMDFLKGRVLDREEEWKKERHDYQTLITELREQLENQKNINKQLSERLERLESIKFSFLPNSEMIKKQSIKQLHHRVKSDNGIFLKNDIHDYKLITQPNNEKMISKEKKPLLQNFLKELKNEENDDEQVLNQIYFHSPINLQLPQTTKINQILINQNTYNTCQPKIKHHHQRSNSNGATELLNFAIQRKKQILETSQNQLEGVSMTEREIIVGKEIFQTKGQLRSHLDGVRSILFQNNCIVTASEDCTIKLWNLNQIQSMNAQTHLEPAQTIRQHDRPIFTMTAYSKTPYIHLYSAGVDGTIRTYIGSGDQYFSWHAHTDVIWSLKHHPHDQRLLSSSADGSVKMWKSLGVCYQNDLLKKGNLNLEMLQNPLANFTFKKSMTGLSIPTAIEWICKGFNETIICGYSDTLTFIVYDVTSVKAIQQIRFDSENQFNLFAQPNRVLFNNELKYIVSGHDDNKIRFSDINTSKVCKTLIGHTDAVTDLCLLPKNIYQLASVSHDGSLRTWDIRKFQCLHEIPAHKQKYDESIYTIASNNQFVATGGADGIVKIFNYSDVI